MYDNDEDESYPALWEAIYIREIGQVTTLTGVAYQEVPRVRQYRNNSSRKLSSDSEVSSW
jgi:hypothetical protein